MLTFRTKACAAVALALCAVAVQAATVELTAEVSVKTYETGQLVGGQAVYESVPGFSPQHFDLTIRFDTDNPVIEEGDFAVLPTLREVGSSFVNGASSTSLSPFSVSMQARLPDPATVDVQTFTLVDVYRSAHLVQPPEPVYVVGSFMTGVGYSADSNGVYTTYNRGFNFSLTGDAVPAETLHAWSGEEFVKFLQAHVGEPGFGAFTEDVTKLYHVDGDPVYVDAARVLGDVTIRSVAVVPEPATCALMGAGLVGLAAMMRRRRT